MQGAPDIAALIGLETLRHGFGYRRQCLRVARAVRRSREAGAGAWNIAHQLPQAYASRRFVAAGFRQRPPGK
jgi:hypothetical protein